MQQRSFIHHLVVPFLIGMLALGGYVIYKNNPEIMNQETYFRKLANNAEKSDIRIVTAKTLHSPPESIDKNVKSNVGKISHRMVPADSSRFSEFDLPSNLITWRFVLDRFLSLSSKQISVVSADGTPQWSFSAAADDTFVDGAISTLGQSWYITTRLGKIYAFDFLTGDLIWFRESRNVYFLQSMVSKDFLLTFVEEAAGQKWALEILNPRTGETLQSLKNLELPLSGAPIATESAMYFATLNGQLHALNIRSAKEIWASEGSSSFRSGPQVVGDKVILTNEDGLLLGFDRTNGKKVYEIEMGSVVLEPFQVVDGYGIALSIDAKGYVMAADLRTGKRIWRYNLNQSQVQPNFHLYQLSSQSLTQLNFDSKVKGWTAWASCSNSRVCIFDVKDGRLLHRIDVKSELSGPFDVAPSSELLFVTVKGRSAENENKPGEIAKVIAFEEYVKPSAKANTPSQPGEASSSSKTD